MAAHKSGAPFDKLRVTLHDTLWVCHGELVESMPAKLHPSLKGYSEIVNTAAIKGERVILLSKNKPKAAIVSLKDLELLENPGMKRARRLAQIERIRKIRNGLHQKGVVSDSQMTLQKIREGRIEKLSNIN